MNLMGLILHAFGPARVPAVRARAQTGKAAEAAALEKQRREAAEAARRAAEAEAKARAQAEAAEKQRLAEEAERGS